jgi:biopolymer transport protein ExbB
LRTTSLLQLKKLFKTIKIRKMANVKKNTSNGGGMVSGLIIMACIGVGY